MYRHGKKRRLRKGSTVFLVCLITASIGFGIWGLLSHDVRSGTTHSDDQVIVTRVAGDTTNNVVVDEPFFRLELPGDWVLEKKDERPRKVYYFKSIKSGLGDGTRTLVMYVDGETSSYAVNRIVPVSAQNNRLVVGQTSNNCSEFTGPGTSSAQAAQSLPDTIARWQNISFLCDLSHMNRNTIGTSSSEGINKLSVTGPSGTTHAYFMLYTDHNDKPDYTIFEKILASFEAK